MQNPKTRFVFTGFRQVSEFRVFAFEGVTGDLTRTAFTVRADLALTRRYGIHLQELPLLCKALLEQSLEGGSKREFTYTEADMGQYAKSEAERKVAGQKRHVPRRPPPQNLGTAWRAPIR